MELQAWVGESGLMLIAELTVKPAERTIIGPLGSAALEPLVMALLIELASRAGTLVPRRDLFQRLWGSIAVGDDNLNRLVAALRRTLSNIGATSIAVQTVPASGYILRLEPSTCRGAVENETQQALYEAVDSWRLGLPEPDHLRIALLKRALEMGSQEPRLFGLLALLCRHAAEYAPPDRAGEHVASCEQAARRALGLDPLQIEAATALVSVAPLFGSWIDSSRRLQEICAFAGGHAVPENDLSVVEMATGQVLAAKQRREKLSATDGLAAHFSYKLVYQNWSVGNYKEMDHLADRAMQLWPLHPAVWMARFWTLAYSARLPAALAMLSQTAPRAIPQPMPAFLRQTVDAATSSGGATIDQAVGNAVALAARGPAQAIASLFALGLFGRIDESFAVARRYYLRDGEVPVPLQPQADHPQLNEQHRRVTQILFTPACSAMRDDARFPDLCSAISLTDFWNETGITPDYLR